MCLQPFCHKIYGGLEAHDCGRPVPLSTVPLPFLNPAMCSATAALCTRCGSKYYSGFIGNLISFKAMKEYCENRLTFDEVDAMSGPDGPLFRDKVYIFNFFLRTAIR